MNVGESAEYLGFTQQVLIMYRIRGVFTQCTI